MVDAADHYRDAEPVGVLHPDDAAALAAITAAPTLVAEHPAKWSASVLTALIEIVAVEASQLERRLDVLDPFCGVGRERLAAAFDQVAVVTGVELQPEWGDEQTITGDATDLPAEWSGHFDACITSACYGNRMADDFQAADACKACNGRGITEPFATSGTECIVCKGYGVSWRNTYAHALRRQGGDLMEGSAAGMNWGWRYRDLHADAISEMLRVTRPGGLIIVNMSNHIRGGEEQQVVEWWLNQLLHAYCSVVEVRRVRTPRQRNGANGEARVDGEVVMVMRTPTEARLW